mmetsp:Transcript_17283/g.58673  ORF Transcript_17283/g.58673 Transcript_17283/m.58673 type:complete len:271 (+) Transcript_17283:188-1000(+)
MARAVKARAKVHALHVEVELHGNEHLVLLDARDRALQLHGALPVDAVVAESALVRDALGEGEGAPAVSDAVSHHAPEALAVGQLEVPAALHLVAHPCALVLEPVRELEDPAAVAHVVLPLPLVGAAVGPREGAAAPALAVAPLSVVLAAVPRHVLALAVAHPVAPLSRVPVAVGEVERAVAVDGALVPLPRVEHLALARHELALAVLAAVGPLPLVHEAVGEEARALALPLAGHPPTLVQLARLLVLEGHGVVVHHLQRAHGPGLVLAGA